MAECSALVVRPGRQGIIMSYMFLNLPQERPVVRSQNL